MLRNFMFRAPLAKSLVTSYSTQAATAAVPKKSPRLFAAACIERMPVVSTEMNDIEKRYFDYINKIDLQRSLYADHELRHLKDIEKSKKKKTEDEDMIVETAVDFEEKCQAELNSFKLADRVAPENEKGNFKNINRILDKRVILLAKNKETNNWEFPSIEWKDGESLRKTAERSVNKLTESYELNFMGNAPIGFLKSYDKPTSTVKKFYFFKAQVAVVKNSELLKNDEFVWVVKDELKNYIKSEEYLNTINKFILEL